VVGALLLADGVTAIKLEARLELRVLRIDCSSYMRCTLDRPRGVRPVGAADGLDDGLCACRPTGDRVETRDGGLLVREGGRSGRWLAFACPLTSPWARGLLLRATLVGVLVLELWAGLGDS